MSDKYDALALFSGGLDSILACRVVQDQGLKVLGLNFTTPFFGKPDMIDHWQKVYGVEVRCVDIADDYVNMLIDGPDHGFGKLLNPCVDCKIIMIRKAVSLMVQYGAGFIVTGEVIGQRPMSQRRDALNQIRNCADARDVLVRPLCARRMDPTPAEEKGLLDRERLLGFGGRGRKEQMALADKYGITEIPTPGGGCPLTEPDSAARFFNLFRSEHRPVASDFDLACIGRQKWSGDHWLAMGRNQSDNKRLQELVRPADLMFRVKRFPGPLALGRRLPGQDWDSEAVHSAAALLASYSGKAVKSKVPVEVTIQRGKRVSTVTVMPSRDPEPAWSDPGILGLKVWKTERGL